MHVPVASNLARGNFGAAAGEAVVGMALFSSALKGVNAQTAGTCPAGTGSLTLTKSYSNPTLCAPGSPANPTRYVQSGTPALTIISGQKTFVSQGNELVSSDGKTGMTVSQKTGGEFDNCNFVATVLNRNPETCLTATTTSAPAHSDVSWHTITGSGNPASATGTATTSSSVSTSSSEGPGPTNFVNRKLGAGIAGLMGLAAAL